MLHAYQKIDQWVPYDEDSIFRDKASDKTASWHPGPGGHLLRAEVLAYDFLSYFVQFIQDILGVLDQSS